MYQGHIDGSGVQKHSAGDIFPFVVEKVEQYTNHGVLVRAFYRVVGDTEEFLTGVEAEQRGLTKKAYVSKIKIVKSSEGAVNEIN
jgi:hypothetical protein